MKSDTQPSTIPSLLLPVKPGNGDKDYMEALITEAGAAEFLSFAPRTLANWRFRGGGPQFVRFRARTVRYRRKDLVAWLEERLVSNTSETPDAA
jgi:hypothetical protein